MPDSVPDSHVQAKILVGATMVSASGKSSAVLDAFASWLLAGCSAVIALLLSNLDSISSYIAVADIKLAAFWLIAASCIVAIQKYISSIIGSTAEASAAARELVKPLLEQGIEVDLDLIFTEMQKAVFQPGRWFAARSLAKFKRGDYASVGRTCAKWAQIQGLLVIISAGFMLWAMAIVARALGS